MIPAVHGLIFFSEIGQKHLEMAICYFCPQKPFNFLLAN